MGHALQTVHRRDNKVDIVRGIVVEDIGWLKILHVTGGFRANQTAASTCGREQS